ncbi:MAG: DUF1292 domain-containing protein [Candidatus Bathyarchaeota archaeon]|uniref:DUF1292 domain-containing protein n=1 Tax=Candidatus Bathycorpusculum sp. TaxID=2994959 RepID=UPI0028185E3E|nr:DUF1292 domain-containing protein [Candidatus Termiticorpusculum sp.]MCL2257379.1 DUF1292 domain-containing protein [Candidatus Termiticorpusculum sp.]MCL2292522.1 DUF1292 domain-containing protein [Candidatus Termiticorpusculum sp.]
MGEEEKVEIIELYDEEGGSEKFEHLDTIELDGAKYVIITPFIEDLKDDVDDNDENECEIHIMRHATSDDGEDVLEMVEDDNEGKKVFEKFKQKHEKDYNFA